VFYRTLLYRHTYKSEFDVDNLTDLPKVDIAYGYQEGRGQRLMRWWRMARRGLAG